MWLVSGSAIAIASRTLKSSMDHRQAPLMGVLGALVFAAQMVNFAIPGTGSSGHFAGGMLLAILLGPHAAFLTQASVLTVQALFFADGGLLALGANIFNMGLAPCYLVYPLVYAPLAGRQRTGRRAKLAALLACLLALQLGALGVVYETSLSGIADLPLAAFLLAMQPIHLAIGVAEGLITLAVIDVITRADPALLRDGTCGAGTGKRLIASLALLAVLAGGVASGFASSQPDGLDWSIAKLLGEGRELSSPEGGLHRLTAGIQAKTAILPDYALQGGAEGGTALSGLLGGLITLFLAGLAGLALRRRRQLTASAGAR